MFLVFIFDSPPPDACEIFGNIVLESEITKGLQNPKDIVEGTRNNGKKR